MISASGPRRRLHRQHHRRPDHRLRGQLWPRLCFSLAGAQKPANADVKAMKKHPSPSPDAPPCRRFRERGNPPASVPAKTADPTTLARPQPCIGTDVRAARRCRVSRVALGSHRSRTTSHTHRSRAPDPSPCPRPSPMRADFAFLSSQIQGAISERTTKRTQIDWNRYDLM